MTAATLSMTTSSTSTEATDPGTSTNVATTAALDTGDADTSTSGGVLDMGGGDPCTVEEFDDEEISPWSLYDGGPPIYVDSGRLVVELLADQVSESAVETMLPSFSEGAVAVQWDEVPSQVSGTSAHLGVSQPGNTALMRLEQEQIYIRLSDENVFVKPWSADQSWWRIVASDGGLSFEVSTDGIAWDVITIERWTYDVDAPVWRVWLRT